MPRWSEHADSQSNHVHVSLLDDSGKPLFFDADGNHTMSLSLRHFIGGLQAHLGDLVLLFAPTVNAYRRFVDGTFAPPALTWGYENRTSCLRVVGDSPDSIRVENRLPGSDANPYLIGAATIAAGLAGLRDSVEPSPELVGNGYSQVAPETLQFPRTMVAAIDQFRNSIFAREWLGDMFVDGFAATRECQEMEFRSKVPDTEKQRFFELG
jgi:glutamine synthetase